MNTSTATHLDNSTVAECKAALDTVIGTLLKTHSEQLIAGADIELVIYGVNNNLQVRDYLMGLPSEIGLGESFNVVTVMRNLCAQLNYETMALDTVLASYCVMNSEPNTAERLLVKGLENNYPLAGLISRVIKSGWPAGAYSSIAEELHPKVIAELSATANELLNESLRDSEVA